MESDKSRKLTVSLKSLTIQRKEPNWLRVVLKVSQSEDDVGIHVPKMSSM